MARLVSRREQAREASPLTFFGSARALGVHGLYRRLITELLDLVWERTFNRR